MQPAPYVKNGLVWEWGGGRLRTTRKGFLFALFLLLRFSGHIQPHAHVFVLVVSLSLACTEGTHTHTVKLGLIQNRWETCVTCRFDPPPLHPQLTFSHTVAATITYTTLGPECYSAKINTEMRWLDLFFFPPVCPVNLFRHQNFFGKLLCMRRWTWTQLFEWCILKGTQYKFHAFFFLLLFI